MHDLVIRGGTVIDGNGAGPRKADVAIAGDKIVAVGDDVGEADREIDAEGNHRDRNQNLDGGASIQSYQIGNTFQPYHQRAQAHPDQTHGPIRSQAHPYHKNGRNNRQHNEYSSDFTLIITLQILIDRNSPQFVRPLLTSQNFLDGTVKSFLIKNLFTTPDS